MVSPRPPSVRRLALSSWRAFSQVRQTCVESGESRLRPSKSRVLCHSWWGVGENAIAPGLLPLLPLPSSSLSASKAGRRYVRICRLHAVLGSHYVLDPPRGGTRRHEGLHELAMVWQRRKLCIRCSAASSEILSLCATTPSCLSRTLHLHSRVKSMYRSRSHYLGFSYTCETAGR